MQTITDDIDYLQFLGVQESQFLISPRELTDAVLKRLAGQSTTQGDVMPWSKTQGKVRFRPGEISLWAGINGHGKSELLGQVCAWGLKKSAWLLMSMEMKPDVSMERIMRQVSGQRLPADKYTRDFLEWTDGKLWIYDQTDTVKSERILGIIHYAAKELEVNHIIVDSLVKCGVASDDYNAQKNFVDRLCWAAKTNNIHIHLVHHIRKSDKETQIPDKLDIKGAGEITDLVDNVFIVHRNKTKERKIAAGDVVNETEPDTRLIIAKQRNGEWEGTFLLWYHQDSKQFIPTPDNRRMFYDKDD